MEKHNFAWLKLSFVRLGNVHQRYLCGDGGVTDVGGCWWYANKYSYPIPPQMNRPSSWGIHGGDDDGGDLADGADDVNI